MVWIDEIFVNGILPPARFSSAASIHHSNMYIFGGKTVNQSLNDTNTQLNFNDLWVLNLEKVSKLEWEKIDIKGIPP